MNCDYIDENRSSFFKRKTFSSSTKKWERVKFYFYPSNMRVMVWKIMKGKYTTIWDHKMGCSFYTVLFILFLILFLWKISEHYILKWDKMNFARLMMMSRRLKNIIRVEWCFFFLSVFCCLKLINLMKRMKKNLVSFKFLSY